MILDNILQIFSWLIIVIPIVILIMGIVAYYFSRKHRRFIGISLTVLGGLGVALFSSVLCVSFIEGHSPVTLTVGILLSVEIATLASGIITLQKEANPVHCL